MEFNNTEVAFKHKSNFELKGILAFKTTLWGICQYSEESFKSFINSKIPTFYNT